MKKIVLFVALAITTGVTALYLLMPKKRPLSPVAEDQTIVASKLNQGNLAKIKFGFLPFWTVSQSNNFQYDLLTHLAYFGVNLLPNGEIEKLAGDGNEEPGWTNYKSARFSEIFRQARKQNTKLILVVRAMDNQTITALLENNAYQAKAADNIIALLTSKNFDGINIDIEYNGTPPPEIKNGLTEFVSTLKQACDKSIGSCHLSIDVFPDAAYKPRLWDLQELNKTIDHFIVMAYDYTRANSKTTGAVAPLRGDCLEESNSCFYKDNVTDTLAAWLKIIPKEKILLGVPYYGYEWQAKSTEPNSPTIAGSGALATYKRIRNILSNNDGVQRYWDKVAASPYLVFKSNGVYHQIFYDDEESLRLKYQLVSAIDLAGIAIWALGYDGDHPELWRLLENF